MLTCASRPAFVAILLSGFCFAQTTHAPMRLTASPAPGSSPHGRSPRSLLLGTPFWADAYTPSYPTPPSVIVVQAPAVPPERAAVVQDEPKPSLPLMIEWQGDRYVRRTAATMASREAQPDYVAEAKPAERGGAAEKLPRTELPPTAFIFRDGHREESSDYSIISGVVYARGDYWTTGSWSKRIPLAQLDLPATLKANQERGVTFRVPAASNEVITRP